MRKFYSRLAQKETKRSVRRTIFYGTLTLVLLLCLVFFGIPTLAKLAIFISDSRNGSSPEKSEEIPPAPPRINFPVEATNSATFSISGAADANYTVEIFQNDVSTKTITASKEGVFQADGFTLTKGKNEFYAISQKQEGNKSHPSEKVLVDFDDIPPELTVDEPKNEAHFSGSGQKNVKVLGKTEPGATLIFNDHLVILDRDGSFSYNYALSDGDNILKIVSSDKAGNQNEKELKVTFSF